MLIIGDSLNNEYTEMNEIAIQQFVKETEEYIRLHSKNMDQRELDSVSELYDDLTAELARQRLFDELYN